MVPKALQHSHNSSPIAKDARKHHQNITLSQQYTFQPMITFLLLVFEARLGGIGVAGGFLGVSFFFTVVFFLGVP
jgi:hypothetical protein